MCDLGAFHFGKADSLLEVVCHFDRLLSTDDAVIEVSLAEALEHSTTERHNASNNEQL